MRGYQELRVWQLGVEISLSVYRLTSSFPKDELYGLTSQLRRASVSVPSNIAEGHTRGTTKDLIRYINIAKGSLAELETQLIISRNLEFGDRSRIEELLKLTDEESRMLSGYRKSLRSRL
jgi:four helix bundle protein